MSQQWAVKSVGEKAGREVLEFRCTFPDGRRAFYKVACKGRVQQIMLEKALAKAEGVDLTQFGEILEKRWLKDGEE